MSLLCRFVSYLNVYHVWNSTRNVGCKANMGRYSIYGAGYVFLKLCSLLPPYIRLLNIGLSPLPITVTTRIITFLVGNPYKPSFATVTGRGDNPNYISEMSSQFRRKLSSPPHG